MSSWGGGVGGVLGRCIVFFLICFFVFVFCFFGLKGLGGPGFSFAKLGLRFDAFRIFRVLGA